MELFSFEEFSENLKHGVYLVTYVSFCQHCFTWEDVGLHLENKGMQFHFTLANKHLKFSAMSDFHSFRLNQLFCLERFSTCCWHHKLFCITGRKRSFIVSLSRSPHNLRDCHFSIDLHLSIRTIEKQNIALYK